MSTIEELEFERDELLDDLKEIKSLLKTRAIDAQRLAVVADHWEQIAHDFTVLIREAPKYPAVGSDQYPNWYNRAQSLLR